MGITCIPNTVRKKARQLRGSIMILGRFWHVSDAYIPKPGGDKIGRRRVDTISTGLSPGAEFKYDTDSKFYSIEAQPKGTYMLMDEASVTGTANIVMAGACRGKNYGLQCSVRAVCSNLPYACFYGC